MTRVRSVPRERDEEVLEWIRLRESGWTWPQIAARFGVTKYQTVQQAVTAVLKEADQ